MVKIEFSLDKDKDVWNWHSTINPPQGHYKYGFDFTQNIPGYIVKELQGKTSEQVADILSPQLDSFYKEGDFENKIIELNEWREKNGLPLLKHMEHIVGMPIPVNTIWAKITTSPRQPYFFQQWGFLYNPLFGKISAPVTKSIGILLHELLHMMTHYYYEQYIRDQGLSHNEFHDLKEAQTVILNQEYKGVLLKPDLGYPSHRENKRKTGGISRKK